jgi:hypothetical protein
LILISGFGLSPLFKFSKKRSCCSNKYQEAIDCILNCGKISHSQNFSFFALTAAKSELKPVQNPPLTLSHF